MSVHPQHRLRHRLTADEIEHVYREIETADEPLSAAVKATFRWLLALEDKSWDDFNATDNRIETIRYAIPDDQWRDIATALQVRGRRDDPDRGFNYALAWMNWGPSSYTATEEAS